MLTQGLWFSLGITALVLGIIGVVLPLLPTTPFLLLAAFSFSKSSRRLHTWLIEHQTFGPLINNWTEHGAIARGAKWAATLSIGAIFCLSLVMSVPWWALAAQAAVLTCVLTFIWTRPDH